MEVTTVQVEVRDQTHVAEARRQAESAAMREGFDEADVGRAAIVATELGTNLLKHAAGGEILIDRAQGLQILALDKGPGMADVEACMTDGYSTGGTRGEGLGAARRQAETFEVYSRPGQGAAVLARLTAGRAPSPAPAWAAVCIPYPGETLCGDAWRVRIDDGVPTLITVDGLGHGLFAHEASLAALEAFDKHGIKPLTEVLDHLHGALRPTRGAAVSLARLHADRVEFAGVGNVAGVVASGATGRRMISHNGTLGHIARRFQAFDYPVTGPAVLVLHSDGLGTSWTFDRYPGLTASDPALIASVLYRDFNRGRDDVTVLAFRG
ncbi:MAG TPA: ATP-binding SpoIIE family protein phosphatase [Caulobacteraceae bacterium]|jgi:anti-sigma regulatory factor (Ser/Thr protein kinase)